MVTVISLGGSIIAPDWVDVSVIAQFVAVVREHLQQDVNRQVVVVVGGGGPARRYQQAYRELVVGPAHDPQDWIGIMATRLNAELIRATLADLCPNPVVSDPSASFEFLGRVLVGAGWKPGFSTDFDAVVLAERFGAQQIINISNIEKVYSADPRLEPEAKPLDEITWPDYQAMVGEEWVPGKNLPFDPVATRRAAELGMEVLVVGGQNMAEVAKALHGEKFYGSRIGPGLSSQE